MFNFKAFFATLLLGVPWAFVQEWKKFAGTLTLMIAAITMFIAADPNLEKMAERPALVLVILSAPAFLVGFFMADKRPKNIFLRGLTTLVGGLASWFVIGNLVSYGLESGIIPAWKIDYEAPLEGALAGYVEGHKTLSLDAARRCKTEHDESSAAIQKAKRDLAAMKPRGEAGLTEKIRLDRESKAIDQARSRNLSSAQNDALNARIRAYNRDVQNYNAENKAYFAERDRLGNIIAKGTLADDWHKRCTIKTAIHYDDYRRVCTLRDFDFISGGNYFCKKFPLHKQHMEKQIAKQIKAQAARESD